MASKSIGQFITDVSNPKGNVADFRHAARMFSDDSFRLAPKSKFNYHVSFSIDTRALKSLNFDYRHRNEINMLVKKCELPKFTIATEVLNQYNRKKIVQNKVDYSPINISFHDDRLGVTRQLWENYFAYYYADSTVAKRAGSYNRTAMAGSSFITTPYGFDNNSSVPFFQKITIYQMANKQYASYTLVNPVITAWNHDSLDYGSSVPAEQTMTLAYEAVSYDTGYVSQGNPPGFAEDHYDTLPSPLKLAGGSSNNLFGPAGVLAGAESVFGAVSSMLSDPSSVTINDILRTGTQAINTYNSAKNLNIAAVRNELSTAGYNAAVIGARSIVNQPISGLTNFSFPLGDGGITKTIAAPRDLGP
jgi:hypothetical protein